MGCLTVVKMNNMNLDNFELNKMSYILTKETTLERYSFFIQNKEKLFLFFKKHNLFYKNQFDDFYRADCNVMKNELCLDNRQSNLLFHLIHLHDFKNRSLKDMPSIGDNMIYACRENGIKKSLDVFTFLESHTIKELGYLLNQSVKETQRMVSFCSLMRLPGVADTRASLYFDCGLTSIESFKKNYNQLNKQINEYIICHKDLRTPPLRKELMTQIAVAYLLCD